MLKDNTYISLYSHIPKQTKEDRLKGKYKNTFKHLARHTWIHTNILTQPYQHQS